MSKENSIEKVEQKSTPKNKTKKEEYIIKSDLKNRGWTDKLILKHLPAPIIRKNQNYYGVHYLYKLSDVKKAEKRKEVKEAIEKKQQRIENKKNKEVEKISFLSENISTINPANDYPKARSNKRHFILNIGETNTGKTYTALEALKQAKTGVYLAPLRLLAMEIQDTLNENGCICSLLTGEEEDIIPFSTVISSTVEKLDINAKYEVAVIDECQMISDPFRGGSWTRAILGVQAKTVYLCLAPSAEEVCIKLIELCGDTYEINKCKRKTPLEYGGSIAAEFLERGDAVIVFSRKNVLAYARDLNNMGYKTSVVYGALPYKSRKKEVEDYKIGKTDILVATDAIGMGLNLPIKRVLFSTYKKFDGFEFRPLLEQEVKQIAGRAGRLGLYDKGEYGSFQYGVNEKFLINSIEQEPSITKTVKVPFPEECLNNNIKVSETIKLWQKVNYSEPFEHVSMSEILERVKYLEKSFKKLSHLKIYKLSSVMFSNSEEELLELWKLYVSKYVKKKTVSLPNKWEEMDLSELEIFYKKLDLYYSFCKTMDLPIELEELRSLKEDVCEEINGLLLEEKSKETVCAICGKPISSFSEYDTHKKCYLKEKYGKYYYEMCKKDYDYDYDYDYYDFNYDFD